MKSFLNYLNEQKEENEIKIFNVSPKFVEWIGKLKDEYKAGELLWQIKEGVKKEHLTMFPSDYFKIEPDGLISFLKSKFLDDSNPWESTRRMKLKVNKALKEIYNDQYLNSKLNQTDIESIINKFNSLFTMSCRIEEFRGEDVLRGYNYKNEFNTRFGHSCANFNQKSLGGSYREPWVDEYDVYVKNPENCGVVVVWDNGKIVARRNFQGGIQVCDSGDFKEGEFHMVWGNYYGIGGDSSKYDIMIKDYLKRKYNANQKQGGNNYSALCIQMETRWKNYPAFDSMYVCFDPPLLSDRPERLPAPYRNFTWKSTYPSMDHLHCPEIYIKKRIDEEKKEEKL